MGGMVIAIGLVLLIVGIVVTLQQPKSERFKQYVDIDPLDPRARNWKNGKPMKPGAYMASVGFSLLLIGIAAAMATHAGSSRHDYSRPTYADTCPSATDMLGFPRTRSYIESC